MGTVKAGRSAQLSASFANVRAQFATMTTAFQVAMHERDLLLGSLGALAREVELATACCDLHGRNCEPPSELCCHDCTEVAHPLHADGSACSSPDLSGSGP